MIRREGQSERDAEQSMVTANRQIQLNKAVSRMEGLTDGFCKFKNLRYKRAE